MVNRIVLVGRLTRDPEMRYTSNGVPNATFSIAVDRIPGANAQEKETDFINCIAWRQSAEFLGNYGKKGRLIAVDGRLQMRKYEDREGNKRTAAEVVVDRLQLLDKPADVRSNDDSAAPAAAAPEENWPTADPDAYGA